MFLALAVCVTGVGYFFGYTRFLGIGVPFASRFGEVAGSPVELLFLVFRDPEKFFRALARPLSWRYLFFFAAATLAWIYPRWRVLKFFIPVLPYLILNSLANAGTMQMIKDHYALPLGVGLSATLVLGVFQHVLRTYDQMSPQRVSRLAFAVLFPTLLAGGQSSFRTFKEGFRVWTARADSRDAVRGIRRNKDIVVCCEERLCTTLIDRAHVFEAAKCVADPKLIQGLRSKKLVYVVYADSKIALASDIRWETQTDLLKVSTPTVIGEER